MAKAEPTRVKVTLAVPFETAWKAFRDPAEIRRWHGWDYSGLDDEIRCIFGDETTASEADGTLHIATHLFALEESAGKTVVRVARATPTTAEVDWDRYYDDIDEGWLTFLQQLRFALDRHPGQDRRTLRLAGDAAAPEPPPLAAALGLADVRELRVGRRYQAATPWGERLGGRVWFRSTLQVGVTVDAWGDGLLIVSESPSARPPHGTGSAVLTTYGLDDAALAPMAQRWVSWWRENYPAADGGAGAG